VLTLSETIDWMFSMKADFKRDIGIQNPGLYIELKDTAWY